MKQRGSAALSHGLSGRINLMDALPDKPGE